MRMARGTRLLLLGVGLIVPALTLMPLGVVWLWQQGYALHWAAGSCLLTLGVYLLQRWLLRAPGPRAAPAPGTAETAAGPPPGDGTPDPGWTPAELAAWARVTEIALAVKTEELTSREAFMALAQRTIEAVAHEIHPRQTEPLWHFTVPEALALIERVSGRLRTGIADSVPLGDRLTVAQALKLYRWRSAIGVAERAYDLWRLVRVVNPMAAATQELREQATRRLYEWGREELGARLARKFVFEIGRGAIDLYGGRLRLSSAELATHVSARSKRDQASAAEALATAEPLRILIAGQISAGKSSLVNALMRQVRAAVDVLPTTPGVTAHVLTREGEPPTLLLDTRGLAGEPDETQRLAGEADGSDFILWVTNAARADREADRAALAALRAEFARRPDRRMPPMLLVLSHVDRLRPFAEWKPPYDLDAVSPAPKAASIRAAIEAASADLGFSTDAVVPACLDEGAGLYNVEAIWAGIMARLSEAKRTQLVRCIGEHKASLDWGKVWSQTLGAGRVLTSLVRR
jgi:predicted GTPase